MLEHQDRLVEAGFANTDAFRSNRWWQCVPAEAVFLTDVLIGLFDSHVDISLS